VEFSPALDRPLLAGDEVVLVGDAGSLERARASFHAEA
jgi:K+/H+ antiporter YhaU regulatory subunit KhtT